MRRMLLSLSKFVIVVDADVDVQDFGAVLVHVGSNVDPRRDTVTMEIARDLMPIVMPLSYVVLGISRAVLKLIARKRLQYLAIDLGQALLFAGLIYLWRRAGFGSSLLSVAGLVMLYVAGDLLVTILLFITGLVRIARRRPG